MASPQNFNDLYQVDTDAKFRSWGLALSTAIQACGLTLVADTGSVNWTTVSKPSSTNTKAGFEIYRFDDALQATAPVYIRIDYGSGQYANVTAAIWFTIGSGTNGSGTVTGNPTTPPKIELYPHATVAGTTYVTGANNRLLYMGPTNQQYTYTSMFNIERTHDGTGADTADGVLLIWIEAGSTKGQNVWIAGTGAGTTETSFGVLNPATGSGATGSYIAVYPFFHTKGIFHFPAMNVLAAFTTNISVGTPFSLTYYGSSKTYLPIASAAVLSTPRGGTMSWCIRYE
jgi:hypothetical protein